METVRKPLQGVGNIIRFNGHFYVGAFLGFSLLYCIAAFIPETYAIFVEVLLLLSALSVMVTLLVSWYVYDVSSLYSLQWLNSLCLSKEANIINIHAGFDETSALLHDKLQPKKLTVFDFYNPEKHTEVSIQRARKVYPPYPNTQQVDTQHLPLKAGESTYIFSILAAHEIRNDEERVHFFQQLRDALADEGKMIITEHLRDMANFFAYNIGFFHFHSKHTWLSTFRKAQLVVEDEIKITPFISTFILRKNGNSS